MAGIYLHRHIIQSVPGVSSDSDHVDIWHMSDVGRMPDRSEFLFGEVDVNPADIMAENVLGIGGYLHSKGRKWVVAIPCATFHAPEIFERFRSKVERVGGCIRAVNMVDKTVGFVQNYPQYIKKVGILATAGSVKAGVWERPFEDAGYSVLNICDSSQHELHKAIYDSEYGLKCKTPPSIQSQDIIYKACIELKDKGAEAIILGCTELPLVEEYLVSRIGREVVVCDPLKVIALRLIKYCDYIDQSYSSSVLWAAMMENKVSVL